jgi:hypothetical protein
VLHTRIFRLRRLENSGTSDNLSRSPVLHPSLSKPKQRLDCQRLSVLSGSEDIWDGLTSKIQIANDRKKMRTSCAIEAYRDLAPVIFKRSLGSHIGSALINPILGRPWYKAKPFEDAVQKVIENQLRELKPSEQSSQLRAWTTGSGKM